MFAALRYAGIVVIAFCTGFLFSGGVLIAESPESTQTWKFPAKDGGVTEISLTTFQSHAAFGIWSEGGAHPSTKEESVFWDQVLGSLPSGVSLDRLSHIELRLLESDALRQVAVYASQSKKWRAALRSRSVPVVYGLVTDFLNESNAYAEWNTSFRKHGLMIHVAGVEKVSLQAFNQSGARCPPTTNCKGLSVPSDAMVQINIDRALSH